MKLPYFFRRHFGQGLTLVSAVSLALFTTVQAPWFGLLLAIGIAAAILSLVVDSRDQDYNRQLIAERDEAAARTTALERDRESTADSAMMAAYALTVDMARLCAADYNTIRASVYVRGAAEWILVTRYSANATFQESGRRTVPFNSGLLHRAFERSRAEAFDLPDRGRAPAQYEREQGKLGLPSGLSSKLTMPSRSYALFRFEGAPTEPRSRIFILCVESTEPQGIGPADVSDALSRWWPSFHKVFDNTVQTNALIPAKQK